MARWHASTRRRTGHSRRLTGQLTIHACLPICRSRENPYCSKSSTVTLNRKRPGASRPAVTSGIASMKPPPAWAIWSTAPSTAAWAIPWPRCFLPTLEARDPPVRVPRRVLVVFTPMVDTGGHRRRRCHRADHHLISTTDLHGVVSYTKITDVVPLRHGARVTMPSATGSAGGTRMARLRG
jgi:hypothetical protein